MFLFPINLMMFGRIFSNSMGNYWGLGSGEDAGVAGLDGGMPFMLVAP